MCLTASFLLHLMKSMFEFPKELKDDLRELNKRYLSDFSEVSLDNYVREHASKEFIGKYIIKSSRKKERL